MEQTVEQTPQPQLGSFVLATRVDNELDCKGVFRQENPDGTIMVDTRLFGTLVCKSNADVIPEEEIKDDKHTQIFLKKARGTAIISKK